MRPDIMKCLVVLTVVVAVIGAAQGDVLERTTESPKFCAQEISDMCPDIDGSSPIFFPDPTDCSAYCECSDGHAYHFQCPDKTLYDDQLFTCNWPAMVTCGSRPILP